MKFYDRKAELAFLEKIQKISKKKGSLTVVTGRRRLGKTCLIRQFLKKHRGFYFFISKKKEKNLLREFSDTLRKEYPELPQIFNFDDLFNFLFKRAEKENILIVFDEFQNFQFVNPAVFSILQKYWDKNKETAKIHFIIIGSLFSLMEKIFGNKHEPLFGRNTAKIKLRPFSPNTIKNILKDHDTISSNRLLNFYTLFGGTAKYYDIVDYYNLYGKNIFDIIDQLLLRPFAPLQQEGKELVIEEFGKNYQTFFSILEAVATGQTRLDEIANYTGMELQSLSKYIHELQFVYNLVERRVPITEKEQRRLGRYFITDQFLRFWFRFIYKYRSLIEIFKDQELLKIIKRDMRILQGKSFENLVKEIILEDKHFFFSFDKIGNYWDRKGINEIDLVLLNSLKSEVLFIECKLQGSKINQKTITNLKAKAEKVQWRNKYRKNVYAVCILDKMNSRLKELAEKEKITIFDESYFIALKSDKKK